MWTQVVIPIIIVMIILTSQESEAQDLQPSDSQPKKSLKMESSLIKLYDMKLKGQDISGISGITLSPDFEKVQVIIELNNNISTLPQNLGIEVETSYENLVQAMVPILNLESISSHENVKLIRVPIDPVTTPSTITIQNESDGFNNLVYLVLIPAVVIPIIYYKKKKGVVNSHE